MKYKIIPFLVIFLFYRMPLWASVLGAASVVTLVTPFGSRTTGMGEVGTALIDNDAALYYNPAGLGIPNKAWDRGSVSTFFEPLLPSYNLPDLWHTSIACYYQPSKKTIGGFGVYTSKVNMGQNGTMDAFGHEGGSPHASERVIALGWGFNMSMDGVSNNNFGLTAKYIRSTLGYKNGRNDESTGQTFAFDFGYLRLFKYDLKLGFTAMNMGPNIFYIDRSNPDPLPFTMNFALAYEKQIFYGEILNFSFAAETRCGREFVKNNFDRGPDPFYKAIYTDWKDDSFKQNMTEFKWYNGFELGVMNTGFFRHGFVIDRSGERYEQTFGFGLRLFNHLNYDWSIIYSPDGYMRGMSGRFWDCGSTGVRDGQWRVSCSYISMFRMWTEDDRHWWRSR